MSALDDARVVLATRFETIEDMSEGYHEALAALVAECESERAQLGELLVRVDRLEVASRVVREHLSQAHDQASKPAHASWYRQRMTTLDDALADNEHQKAGQHRP